MISHRYILRLLSLSLVPHSAWCQATLSSADASPATGVLVDRVEIGDLVAAQYLPDMNRFLLYATREERRSMLYRDDIVQLARTALQVGDFGFSLDFLRRGTAAFRPTDILDWNGVADQLLTGDHPLARALRERFRGDEHLKALRAADPYKTPQDGGRLVRFLNQARRMEDLWRLLKPDEISPEAAAIRQAPLHDQKAKERVGRLLLEDFFFPALRRDIDDTYVIAYKPVSQHPLLVQILDGTRTESALLVADTWLKRLGGGSNVPSDLVYGPSELALCTSEAQELVQRRQPVSVGEYMNFFALDVDYDVGGLPGISLWFRSPRIVVKASGVGDAPAPPCSERFAISLTRRIPNLLEYDGQIGTEIKALRELLVLHRAMSFLVSVTPVDLRRLGSIPTERLRNEPPKVMNVPVYFAQDGEPRGFAVSGGVQFQTAALCLVGLPLASTAAVQADSATAVNSPPDSRDPGFVVTPVTVGGKQLLQIDISSILGLSSDK